MVRVFIYLRTYVPTTFITYCSLSHFNGSPIFSSFQMTTFSDRPGYLRVSSSLWKQREDYCASLIQKAWKFHKLRNTETHTDEPHTGDEEEESSLCQTSDKDNSSTVKLPPISSKHLIEVRSADSADPHSS